MDYSDDDFRPDGQEVSFNGEIATIQELEALECLAHSLLNSATPELYHLYGYRTDSGITVQFQTSLSETPDPKPAKTSITISRDGEDPFFVFGLDEDNELEDDFLDSEVGYHGLVIAIQEIIDKEALDDVERVLLEHIEGLALQLQFEESLDDEYKSFFTDGMPERTSKVSDYIRHIVATHTNAGIRVREVSPFDDDSVQIVLNEFVGEQDEVEVEEFPQFQVLVKDPKTSIFHNYTIDFSGARMLVTGDHVDIYVGEEPEPDHFDAEVEELSVSWGMYAPSKADVAMITEALIGACMYTNGLGQIE